jgi:tryptophan synthase beta subunit
MPTETIYHEIGDIHLYIKNVFKIYVQCMKVKSIAIGPGTLHKAVKLLIKIVCASKIRSFCVSTAM